MPNQMTTAAPVDISTVSFFESGTYGGDCFYKLAYGITVLNTVKDFVQERECFELLELISRYAPQIRHEPFLVACFVLDGNGGGTFFVRRDTNEPDLVTQHVDLTALTVNVKFFICDGLVLFPSDY